MQIISQTDKHLLIRFDKGEEVIHMLGQYAKEHTQVGTFTAIGAAAHVMLSYYDLGNKTYLDKAFSEELEITGVIGNITTMDDKIVLHAHGTFSDRNYSVIGGHVKTLVVSATCEVSLTLLPHPIQRTYDEKTGLNLLACP